MRRALAATICAVLWTATPAGLPRAQVVTGICCGGGGACGPCRAPQSAPPQRPREDVQREREAKDLDEAAQDAEDNGERAYRNGNWASAARYFNEVLSYAPDDQIARRNLQKAQHQLDLAAAARQPAAPPRIALDRPVVSPSQNLDPWTRSTV